MAKLVRFVMLLLLSAVPLLAQGSIDTIPSWNGTDYISSFGVVNTATYGQTITVAGTGGELSSFSFEIGYCGADVTLRGEVYAWNGSMATGPALFESPAMPVTNSSAFQLVTINTGTLILQPGTYALFVSTSRDQAGAPGSVCRFGSVTNTAYPGGQFVFINNGPDPAQWTSTNWSTIPSDLAMRISFRAYAIPTLSEWGIILLACGLVFIATRRLLRSSASRPAAS